MSAKVILACTACVKIQKTRGSVFVTKDGLARSVKSMFWNVAANLVKTLEFARIMSIFTE